MGYSIPDVKNPKFDYSNIQVNKFIKQVFENEDFNRLSSILSKSEIQLINAAEVFELTINGKTIFHIKDLEDGDFIGIDMNKKIYMVTHDPLELKELNKSMAEVL